MTSKLDTRKSTSRPPLTVWTLSLGALILGVSAWCQGIEQQVDSLSATLAEQIAKAGKKSVAVVDFMDLQGSVTELGKYLAEELSGALAQSRKGFVVVDRANLRLVLQEQNLASTGLMDPATVQKLGKLAGVDILVTGTLTPFGESVRLSLKLLDTATAKVIGAARGDIPKTKAVEELLGRGVAATRPARAEAAHGPIPGPVVQSVTIKGFLFTLESCKARGGELRCVGHVTSQDSDRRLYIDKSSRVVDSRGNEYSLSSAQLGAAKLQYGKVGNYLVAGVAMRLILNFGSAPSDLGFLQLVQLDCYTDVYTSSGNFSALFRRVPVSE